MKFVILYVGLLSWSASANPTPQGFQFQPFTPVGQWVQNSLQNTLQAVQNIPNIFRPGSQGIPPNQNPNPNPSSQVQFPQNQSPQNQFPLNQFPQNQFSQNQFPQNQFPQNQFPQNQFPQNPFPQNQLSQSQFPSAAYPGENYPVQSFQSPSFQQIAPTGQWPPPRQLGHNELYWQNWVQLPFIPNYTQGEPTIIIISRPSKRPEMHHETPTNETEPAINSSLGESTNTSSNATNSTASYTTTTGAMDFDESTTPSSTFVPTSGDKCLINRIMNR